MKAKQKHSARKRDDRRPFTDEEVRKILDYVSGSNSPKFGRKTIDFWAPWISAYQGTRIQEVCQLRLCDFDEKDGVWAMQITDEGADMRVKSASSVRWVPVHLMLLELGLKSHIETQGKGKSQDALAFEQWGRYSKKLEPLSKDKCRRVSGPYGKRFGRVLRKDLDIRDSKAVFHSFRHRLQDAADNVGIPDAHRRYLTGRANCDPVEAEYEEGAGMNFLMPSLTQFDHLS